MAQRTPPLLVARGVLAVRRLLLRAADRIVPAELALFEHTIAFGRTRLLGALAEHGVADALADRPATADELAGRLGLHADTLHRVLRALAVYGIVRLDRRGRFSLPRSSQPLRGDHPRSLRSWTRYLNLESTQAAWAAVSDTVRTGEPSFPAVHGRSVWDHLAANPEEERTFAAAMRTFTELDAATIAGSYPWPEEGTVCDVAGGVGTLLAAVLQGRPRLRGALVEAEGVLGEAGRYLEARGVRDRVELTPGDMFERVDAAADVYVLKDILHDWDDRRCLQVLRTTRAAMAPGARVVLVEALQERDRVEPVASLVDVHMLTQTDGGRQRSVAELHELLRAAGLRPGEVRRTAGPALVEGVAA